MKDLFSRRDTIAGMGALAAISALNAGSAFASLTGVPPSPFSADSTAEDVTAGLNLSGKNILVTGVNSGIGYETMRVLSMRGAHVLGTARTQEKAVTACDSVNGKTTPLVCELTDFEGIVACADQAKSSGEPIDAVICNAGIMAIPELEQVNGIEKHFAVNHLGHFILVNQLLDSVNAADQGRIVMLSSFGHENAHEDGIEFDNLSGARDYDPRRAYGQSKLANILFARELARQLQGSTTTANAVDPGMVDTRINRNFGPFMMFIAKTIGPFFFKTVPEGASTPCYVATHPDLATVSGHYFADCEAATPGKNALDDEMAAQLWDVSVDLTKNYLA